MKRSPQRDQVISIILVSLIMVQITGCRIPRSISISQLPVEWNYKYVANADKKKYRLIDPVIGENMITSRIDSTRPGMGKKVILYLPSESMIQKLDSGKVLIPFGSISNVRQSKFSLILTGLTGVAAFYSGMFLYFLLFGGYDM